MNTTKNRPWLWAITFSILFLLTQDYLFVDWDRALSFLGFPIWLGWFMGVHLLFILAFAYFAIKYWKAE